MKDRWDELSGEMMTLLKNLLPFPVKNTSMLHGLLDNKNTE